ncbi:MAG: hypothetical protein P8X47_00645 [Ignavibacteriaceae bacterium]
MQLLSRLSRYTLTLILSLSIILLSSEIYGQSNLKIFEEIGGGSSTSQSSDSNDNSYIYIVGGLLVAGILVYALVLHKDKKAKPDTTASLDSRLLLSNQNEILRTKNEMLKAKEKIPFDFYLGVKNNNAVLNDKTYLLGFRVKL